MARPLTLPFGEHNLDVGTRQLFRGGTAVHLSPKAFDLLRLLIDHRTRALSKEELHDALWPGTFVTEATLASLVAELRRALDDSPRKPKFVRTVHGFGYAFCAEITGAPAAQLPSRTCWIVWRSQEIPLQEGENIIGRDADAAVRVDFPSVSRRHARIVVSPGGATVEDLGSKNGTMVRNRRLDGAASLEDLDELLVGSVRLIVRIMHGAEPTQTVEL